MIRERNANYHVFVFIDGKRPGDELTRASLDDATVEPKPDTKTAAKVESKTAKRLKAKRRRK